MWRCCWREVDGAHYLLIKIFEKAFEIELKKLKKFDGFFGILDFDRTSKQGIRFL